MLRITQLELQQIGPFGDLTLNFPEKPAGMEDKAEIHILTGENGTGKSTVLETMAAIIMPGDFSKITPKLRDSSRTQVKLFINDTEERSLFKAFLEEKKTSFRTTNDNHLIDQKFIKSYENYPRAAFGVAFFAYSGHRRFDTESAINIKEVKTHPFENALDFQKSIDNKNILQWIANNLSKSYVAQGQGDLILAKSLRNSIERLENVISSIIQKEVKFDVDALDLKIWIHIADEKLELNQLHDGLKSVISWIADLLMRMDRVKWENDTPVFERNFILFLDEIEVHLHPAWQRKTLPVVQRLFPKAQIFISTHSPFVVGSVDGAWIHKLVRPNGDSKLAEGYPKLSEDGNSFRYWLDEVFDVSAEFGIGAENQLKEFYALRDEVLKSNDENLNKKLLSKGRELAEQSTELHQIIEMELRQLNRRKSLSLSI